MTQRYIYFTAGLSPSPPSPCHLLSQSLSNRSTGLAKKFVEVFFITSYGKLWFSAKELVLLNCGAGEDFLLLLLNFYLFIYSCTGSSLLHTGFLYLRRGGATLCSTQVSHWGGFSCFRARALDTQASLAMVLGHVESSQTRDQTCVPCIGRQILKPLDHQGSPGKDSWESLGQQA